MRYVYIFLEELKSKIGFATTDISDDCNDETDSVEH